MFQVKIHMRTCFVNYISFCFCSRLITNCASEKVITLIKNLLIFLFLQYQIWSISLKSTNLVHFEINLNLAISSCYLFQYFITFIFFFFISLDTDQFHAEFNSN